MGNLCFVKRSLIKGNQSEQQHTLKRCMFGNFGNDLVLHADNILEQYPSQMIFKGVPKWEYGEHFYEWCQIDGNHLYKGQWLNGVPHRYGMVYIHDLEVIISFCLCHGSIESSTVQILKKDGKQLEMNLSEQDEQIQEFLYDASVALRQLEYRMHYRKIYGSNSYYEKNCEIVYMC